MSDTTNTTESLLKALEQIHAEAVNIIHVHVVLLGKVVWLLRNAGAVNRFKISDRENAESIGAVTFSERNVDISTLSFPSGRFAYLSRRETGLGARLR